MHTLREIIEWAREKGAERSFSRLFRTDFEEAAQSRETVGIELVRRHRPDHHFGSLEIGDIVIEEEKLISSTRMKRRMRRLFRWEPVCKSLPIDEPCGWRRDRTEIRYFRKRFFLGSYDYPVDLKDGLSRDPGFRDRSQPWGR